MSSPLTVSYIITTHKRPEDVVECIDSIRDQSYQPIEVVVITSPVEKTTEHLEEHFSEVPEVRIIEEDSREGPAAAGNVALQNARGEIIVSIDDDAVLTSASTTDRIVEEFESNPELGILAFKIVDFQTGEIATHEIPVGPNGHQPDHRHPTTYFIGAGAAFRGAAIAAVEGYPDEFSYQMQELDLSFQILDAGYDAVYEPDIIVRHKQSQSGRPDQREQWRRLLENRLRVAIRHLPLQYVVSSILIWTPYTFFRTRGSIGAVLDAYLNLIRDRERLLEQRDVISKEAREKARRSGGRLWY